MDRHGHRLDDIARAIGGELHGDGGAWIEHLVVDTRKPVPPDGALFIALPGPRHDGHAYLKEMLARGVRNVIVGSHHPDLPAAANSVRVKDPWDALHRLAAWHRAHFHAPVIGITGSNGKTIVKEWLFHLLREQEHIVRSPGSWNSRLGVPLSVWGMGAEHTLALFEAGISEPDEMERLRAIIRPDIGIFTNIGPAHGENFKNDLEKALEKAVLFREARTLLYCRDHAVVHEAVMRSGLDKQCALRDWSREGSAFVRVIRQERTPHGTRIVALHGPREHAFEIPFADAASVENAMHCISLLLHLGHDAEWIAARLRHLPPVAMRLQMLDGMHDSTLINDAYSNDLASLGVALDHLNAIAQDRERVVVLSDIVESGLAPKELHGRVARLLDRARVRRLLAIGPAMAAHRGSFSGDARFFRDADELLRAVDPAELANAVVLVKGARAFGLERVVERWQEKVHGTVLEIDLEAVRHNLNHYRAMLKPPVRVMAMVKAFGYGGGAPELARLFMHEQVHYLGVAYADEGVELRQNGIRTPVMVMNPEPVPMDLLHRFRLEAVAYDHGSLEAAIHHAGSHSDAPPIHLKLDTGMHRLGFMEEQLAPAIERLRRSPFLRVASIFSHLAASEDPDHDAFTREQIGRFRAMTQAVTDALGYTPLWHLANSGGASRFPEAHFDMVRLGIGLHGIGVDEAETALLRPAASLRTAIAQVKTIAAGDSVGYGRSHVAPGEQRIAVLPVGYADGLSRRLSNGRGKAWVHGRPAPFVGTICMDMCMIDVSGIDCREGDAAFLFHADHPVGEFARDLGTIPYEALTAISSRVKRVYVHA